MIVVIMGVCGCGKSSVGQALAQRQGWAFIEGDSLHPPANRAKMAGGTPLEDADRWPWLDAIVAAARASEAHAQTVVVACSALKRSYRARLAKAGPSVKFVHLSGTRERILARLQARADHFMPPELLDSQLATLEPPDPGPDTLVCDIEGSVDELVEQVLAELA